MGLVGWMRGLVIVLNGWKGFIYGDVWGVYGLLMFRMGGSCGMRKMWYRWFLKRGQVKFRDVVVDGRFEM